MFLFLILSSLTFILPLNTAQAGQVTLAWNRNAEENVVGYNVYYGTSSGNYNWFLDVGNVTTITISDIPDGFTYYFAVTAYDDSSPSLESTYSNEVSKNTCTFSISPTSASFGASGGTGSVSVATQSGCTWSASSSASWLTITSGSSGTGNGTISYSVSANTNPDSRSASSTFAKKVFTVTQSGAVAHTISASAGAGGTISPSGSVSVAQGGSQTFTITPSTGYQVSSVTVDGASVGAVSSYTFSNVTANHTISATFSVKTYTIAASAGTGGTISPSGSVSVNHGSNQTFAITANTGYQIASVTVDSVSQGAISSYTFSNVTGNHTISATFSPITYTIAASTGAGGAISPSGSVSVNYGANQTFTIAANTGYTIADVFVDGSSAGAVTSYTFTNVTSNHTISATFTANTYTITASSDSNGTITPNGSISINHGSSQTFAIVANTGYQISSVTVDGASVGAVSSYTFSNVTANHTISATFSVKTYTITASAGTGGSVSPSGSVSVNHGASKTFTITPNTGYQIASVTVDSVSQGAVSSHTFSNVTAAHTISATFSPITYTITASAGTGGTISPSGSVSVNHGSNKTFSITANTGYTIADVLVDGASVGPVNSYNFSNVTGNHTIVASFNTATYTITASAGTGGSVSPSGSVSVNHGASKTFTITPETGFGITNVLVDGASVGAVSSFTFSNVTGNHTISANFAVNTYTINATAGTGGSISPSGAISVSGGSNQTLVITPNTGYRIADVLVDGSSVGPLTTYTFENITSSHTISVSFVANTYTIISSAGVGGSISPNGSVTVNHGSNQSFTISANTGYQITNVTVDGASVGAVSSYTFSNVTGNHTIAATFSVKTYTLIASAGTGGSISPSGNTSLNHGSNQTFTITPNTGYSIATVTVDGVSQGAVSSYTFSNVTADHTISATFTVNTLTISASAGAGGAISPLGSVAVPYGGGQTFTITPASGYAISNVLVDGVPQGSVGVYTFGNVSSNHTISATFSQITFTINASAGAGGTISPAGSVTVTKGANQTFAFASNLGYVVSDVLVDGSSVGAVASYTFTNVSASHAISVSFAQGYTLTVTKTGTGSGEVSTNPSATVFRPGTKVTLKAVKADSSMFLGFSGDCNTYRSSCTLIMNKSANVNAAFKLKTFRIKTTVVGDGAVSVEGPVSLGDGTKVAKATKTEKIKKSKHEATIDYGGQITFTITPEPGNNIKKVIMDSRSIGNLDRLTIADIKRNHSVRVKFEAEGPAPEGTQIETSNGSTVIHDEDEEKEPPEIVNELAESDNNEGLIAEPTSAGHYASVNY